MSVSISDLDAILKEFYLGPIIESLNNQLEMVQLFTKSTLDWQGRQVVIPVHVTRNDGTGYRAESKDLPDAGKQGYVNMNVTAKYLYGRFSLTGPAISTAKTTANSFATYVQSEMDGVVTDTKIKANQAMFTGGGHVGFTHNTGTVAAGASQVLAFTGDKARLKALQQLDTAFGATSRVKLEVIRLDDYTSAVTGTVLCDPVGSTNAASDDLIEVECLAASSLALTMTGNFAAMISVVSSGKLAGGVYTADAAKVVENLVAAEQNGIYGNLGTQVHFTVRRGGGAALNPAVADQPSMRSTVQSIANGAFGAGATVTAHPNQALAFGRMQSILDEIMLLGGDDPDCIYVHPGIRQKYADLLVFNAPGSIKKAATGDVGTGDPGFSGYAFNGIPLKMSRHCGKGIMAFLKTKTWTITELESFGMADLDGSVLSRLSNRDEFEGFVRWYYNLVCKEPNRNAILVGIAFPA